MHRVCLPALQGRLLSALGPGVGQQLNASACWPAVSLRLVADLPVSDRASGRIRGMGPLDLPWEVMFRLQGRRWVCFLLSSCHMSKPIPDYLPELGRAEPLIGQ